MGEIHRVWTRVYWRAFVDEIMNYGFYKMLPINVPAK